MRDRSFKTIGKVSKDTLASISYALMHHQRLTGRVVRANVRRRPLFSARVC